MDLDPDLLDISAVTFNSERWLDGFVQSLRRQTYPCSRIRLLLRDNGSTDQTVARLREIAANLSGEFAEIRIDEGSNVGFGQGHNANLASARAPWLLVTNVDLEFEAGTLGTLVTTAQADPPEVAAWECRQKPFEHPKHYNPVTGETAWSSSACILYRTDVLRQVGGYEPQIFLYGEDVELSYRLRDQGWRLRYTPTATVWHYAYAHAAEIKPAQFLGSTLANVLLRCRYGSRSEIVRGLLMYLGLFLLKPQIPAQRAHLARNGLKLLRLAPYFLRTRKKSSAHFPFRVWDYEMARHGAFLEYTRHADSTASEPLVSILVRTMAGRAGKLAEAIACIAAQTYQPIELVIVEDGSDTALPQVMQARQTGRFRAVQYRALPKVGRCHAGNAALEISTGELLCFLDDDDLLYADHAEVLVQALRERPQLGGAYALSYEVRTEVIQAEPWVYRDIEHNLRYRQPFSRALMWHHNYLPIQTVMFRRGLYETCGGFDPELENLEDWNLWVRYTLNHDFEMVDKVTSLYRVPARADAALARQHSLDDYYSMALAKHDALRTTLSPNQLLKMAEELARNLYLVTVPKAPLRDAVLSRPWLARLYFPARKAAGWLRKAARRIG